MYIIKKIINNRKGNSIKGKIGDYYMGQYQETMDDLVKRGIIEEEKKDEGKENKTKKLF